MAIKIPFKVASAPFPGVMIDPSVVAAPSRALEEVGGKIERTGLYAARTFEAVADRERKAGQAIRASQLERQLKDSLEKKAELYRGREDFEKFESDADNWAKEIHSEFEPMLKDDPELANAFEVHFNHQIAQFKSIARTKKINVMTKTGLDQWDLDYRDAVNEYATEVDPNRKMIIRNEIEAKGLIFIRRGIMWRRDLDKRMDQFDKDVQEGQITTALASKDEKFILDTVLSVDKGEFRTLSSKERAIYRKSLLDHADRVKKEIETERDKESVDRGYNILKKIFSVGGSSDPAMVNRSYELMYEKLSDPEFLKNMDLTPQRAHQLETILKQQQSLFQGGVKIRQDENSKKVFERVNRMSVTLPEISSMVVKGELSESDGRYYKNEIEQSVKRAEDVKTDWDVQARIREMIANEQPPDLIREEIKKNMDRLSRSDREQLWNTTLAVRDRMEMRALSKAYEYMKNQIIPQFGPLERIVRSAKESKDYADAQSTLDNEITKAKQAGKPLTSAEIDQLGRRIAPLYQKSLAVRMSERAEEMGKVGKEATEIQRIKKLSEKYKTTEEVKRDFEKKKLTPEDAKSILKSKFGMGE